jgi:hypothetical protein
MKLNYLEDVAEQDFFDSCDNVVYVPDDNADYLKVDSEYATRDLRCD